MSVFMRACVMKKKPPLKARGIRFSDIQWDFICKESKKDKTKRTRPSDIVRYAVDSLMQDRGGD